MEEAYPGAAGSGPAGGWRPDSGRVGGAGPDDRGLETKHMAAEDPAGAGFEQAAGGSSAGAGFEWAASGSARPFEQAAGGAAGPGFERAASGSAGSFEQVAGGAAGLSFEGAAADPAGPGFERTAGSFERVAGGSSAGAGFERAAEGSAGPDSERAAGGPAGSAAGPPAEDRPAVSGGGHEPGDEAVDRSESEEPEAAGESGDQDERGIDELIEIAEEIPERLGLSEGLAGIRATARGEGLSVTVDVHGMLVHLDIGESALELGPDALAAEISRLSTEAGTRALHQGLRAVRAGCVPAVAAAVEDALELGDVPDTEPPAAQKQDAPQEPLRAQPAPRRRPPADDHDDEGFVLKPVKD
ncbi:hypothetical protein [Amycolatopsis sp. WGS_07]|uniref:hypothetical protein n=1 Tax=Amycolatopsis sp. WGS_07 TaxID=3076764 RepID=UPI003872B38E